MSARSSDAWPWLVRSPAATDTLPPSPPARGVFAAGVEHLQLWWDRAMQRRRLKNLDAHRLADIGHTRAEVEAEIRKPFWRP